MQQKSNEKSVLLIAYKISVGEGSEPGAGWSSMLGHLICGSRVHLISTSKNITDLVLPDEFHSQADFTSIDLNRNVESFLKRFPFAEQITYFFWNLEVRRHLKIIMTHSKFNFVHQSTFAGDWNPSCILWNLGGSLFWGPIGGTQKVPFGAYKWLGIKSISMEILRLIVTSPLRRLNRYLAKKYDVHVLVANDTTAKFFSKDCKVSRANQIVIEHVKHGPEQFENQLEKFLLGSGRLIGWKMWPIAIKAIAEINSPKSRLIIFGKGPEEIRLNRLIKKMKAVGIIQIKSLIPRTELLSLLQKTQVYVFPSLKDSSPWSLAEALHMGIPIAAFNISGVSEMVPNADVNLASIKGDLESNLAKKILDPYQIAEINSFCHCKLFTQYKDIFYVD
jgi:glycosyltransferase involved in cell wall biosynthesis